MKSFSCFVKYCVGLSFFKITGWSCDLIPKEVGNKFVLIGFPHDTNMDASYGIAFSFYNKMLTNPMVKKEWFWWPMTILFNGIGAVQIDRSSSGDVVHQIAAEFSKRDHFIPVIFPEGTRSPVQKIKTGFWNIAKQGGVPVVMVFKDQPRKRLKILGWLNCTDSMKDDLLTIQAFYRKQGYDIPMQENLQGLE